MSDTASQGNAPKPQPKPHETPRKKGGGPLRIILFVILAIMVGLALLEVYSRTSSSAAFDKVEAWVDDANKKSQAKPEEIHDLLGRQPDNGLEDMGDYYQEVYSWRRGRLFDTYFVKILYEKDGDAAKLYEVVKNTEPQDGDIPRPPSPEGEGVSGGLAGEAGDGGGEAEPANGAPDEPSGTDDTTTDNNDAVEPDDDANE